jgi:hypothetical protein
MLMNASTQDPDFDLSSEELEETAWDAPEGPRAALVQRLDQYRILPPTHDRLPTRALEQVEQLFTTWFELSDDGSRRAALSYIFATENELRVALLAIVPLYYDTLFFDEHTPTRDLLEIALVAHAKWRRWLTSAAPAA